LSQGCFIPNINALGPVVCERNSFQIPKISPNVTSFWASKACPKDAVCQISEYLDRQFMRRRFF